MIIKQNKGKWGQQGSGKVWLDTQIQVSEVKANCFQQAEKWLCVYSILTHRVMIYVESPFPKSQLK